MAGAGVDLAIDMMSHSVTGFSDVVKNLGKFRGFIGQLYRLALERRPDAIICVDFSAFNRRVAHRIKGYTRTHSGWFHEWQPKIVQYVSPQVWASRAGRALKMKLDYDLLLCTFPFEKGWYARHTPGFRVEFVGNPIVDRHSGSNHATPKARTDPDEFRVVLLPGSRADELRRHLPVMLGALEKIQTVLPNVKPRMVLPNELMAQQALRFNVPGNVRVQIGGLGEVLGDADLAIASTGTVTMECAWFGVPTVALYKTTWLTYAIGKRIAKVKYLAMPNLLANEEIVPEFIQHKASPDTIAAAGLEFLRDANRRKDTACKLRGVIASLGGPGASRRAAKWITELVAQVSQPAVSRASQPANYWNHLVR
jgi:lipid-A-disaccharide synthase